MTAHKPTQVVRHAAIVLAGAASLTLTVVSGAYIVDQMAQTHRPGTDELAAPPVKDVVIPAGPGPSDAMLIGGRSDLPAIFVRMPGDKLAGDKVDVSAKTGESHADPATAPATPAGVGGKLRLGTTYVGTQVTPAHTDAVAFTVDTNALTVLSGFLLSDQVREQLGVSADTGGVTQLRTEVDTHSGEVVLAFSDPTLGHHELRVDRHQAPTPKNAPSAPSTSHAPAVADTPVTTPTPDGSPTQSGMTTTKNTVTV